LFERALEEARSILVRRAAALLEFAGVKSSPENLARLRAVIAGELTRLGSSFEVRLAKSGQNMGFGSSLGITVLPKLKSLLTTLDSELEGSTSGRSEGTPSSSSEVFPDLELKPNVYGVGLNLNRILARVRDWWRKRRGA